jgi:hypothetical protein
MENTDPSPIIGVFRDHTKANLAVEELKQAGFREDQITSVAYSLQPAQEEQTPENSRIIVTVKAEGRDKQAFGVLFNSGANNADLPPGMSLIDGNIVSSQAETTDLIAKPTLEAGFSKDSYFGEVTVPGTSDELGISEEPTMGDTH